MIGNRIAQAVALVALAAGQASAQPQEAPDDDGDYWNPEVVTPTGNPTRISETPSATFVITGDEIRRSGAPSLPELLRRVPGVEVRMMGASDGQVSARGFAYELARHVLVLVDGRSAQVDAIGGNAWETLPVSPLDIDRIEVVLGPGAAVYGNTAMLGTINIITRSAADYPRLEAETSVGIEGDARAALRHGVVHGPWRARGTTSLRRRVPFDQEARQGFDHDTASATLHLGYSPSPTGEVSVEGGLTSGQIHVNADATGLNPFLATVGYVRADGRLGLGGPGAPLGELGALAVWSGGKIESGAFPSADTDFRAAYQTSYLELAHSLRYQVRAVPMQLRWGGEARLNTLDSTITSGERDLLNLALFASNEVLFDKVRLTAGARLDSQPLTRPTVSPRLSAVFAPTPRQQLRLALNQGYKNPSLVVSFAEFALPDTNTTVRGDPDLLAERIHYAELGYSLLATDSVRVFANAFTYRLENLIARNLDLATGRLTYVNNPPVLAWGGEAGAQVTLRPFLSAYLNWAPLYLRGAEGFPYQARNVGSPEHKLSAGASYTSPWGLYFSVDGQAFGPSEVDRVPQVNGGGPLRPPYELGRYLMVHGRAGYRMTSGVDVSVAASNVLDDRTVQFPGSEAPRRRMLLSLAYYP